MTRRKRSSSGEKDDVSIEGLRMGNREVDLGGGKGCVRHTRVGKRAQVGIDALRRRRTLRGPKDDIGPSLAD